MVNSKDFQEVDYDRIKIHGYAVKHLLEEVREYRLSEKLTEHFKKNENHLIVYLIQIYDSYYTDTKR